MNQPFPPGLAFGHGLYHGNKEQTSTRVFKRFLYPHVRRMVKYVLCSVSRLFCSAQYPPGSSML